MKEIILIKNGEIALKGLNRSTFEAVLVKNIKRRIKSLGMWEIVKAQSTIYVIPKSDDIDLDTAVERIGKVFGIAALSRALVCEKDFEDIKSKAPIYLKEQLTSAKTFKVTAKRSDKKFPLNSPEICRELGGVLLQSFPHLEVDVHNPDITVTVEIRDFDAYIHAGQITAAGGMPIGTSGKAMLLISGGIDSPVAGYMMAKRGIELSSIHFVSPPYTSERAKQKVVKLGEELCEWCGKMDMHVVHFTDIQEKIMRGCKEELFTVIMRRFMMRIAERIAENEGCSALITGESVAQVASQTLSALCCTDAVVSRPVFRPLIGFDKNEIVILSRKIGTFETSTLPYEDCCTVFTPKHPKTQPNIADIEEEEAKLNIEELIEEAVKNTEKISLRNNF
jgi:thiamine biosynthesis protein ThiI